MKGGDEFGYGEENRVTDLGYLEIKRMVIRSAKTHMGIKAAHATLLS